MLKDSSSRGFTLIEIMVVVSLIVILMAGAVVSISVARNKSIDATIKSSIGNVKSESYVFVTRSIGSVNYSNFCTQTSVMAIMDSIDAKNGAGEDYCNAQPNAWVYAAQFRGDSDQYICSDSNDITQVYTGVLSSPTGMSCATLSP
jgi:prepilin-type N-terminal cleavage/methylation domain-containing protein